MILDIHTHNFHGLEEQLTESAARHGVERYIVLGDVLRDGPNPTADQIHAANDNTLAYVREVAPRALGFCFLNPNLPEDFICAEIERCLAFPEFRGIKLEISTPCRDLTRMAPIMDALQRRGLPLLQHTWTKVTQRHPQASDPADVAILASHWPQVPIIMAHLCGCSYRGVELIADCSNVHVDTSGSQPEAGFVEYAVKRLGPRRVLYGSDAPGRGFGPQLAKVLGADISDADRELILGQNARELLQW